LLPLQTMNRNGHDEQKQQTPAQIERKREWDRTGLQHFFLDLDNRLDPTAQKIVEELREKMEKLIASAQRLERIQKEETDRWAALQEDASRSDIDLDRQITDHYVDASYYEEELIAFAEMQIIYAYKHLEIHVNRLLKAAFSLDQPKGFYNWDAVAAFLKSKNIVTSELAYHQEFKELQAVNNMIKHGGVPDQKVKPIREFAGEDFISAESLLAFYERVRPVPKRFLEDLCDKICQELYHFDQHKLEQIARDLALRMDKKEAMQLNELLARLYE
jgi:hypothetical protein